MLMTTTTEDERSGAMRLAPTVINAPGVVGPVEATVIGIAGMRNLMKRSRLRR